MKFAPKTEKDVSNPRTFKNGIYDYEVTDAVEKESSSGNEMIALTLKVWAQDSTYKVKDWLLEAMAFKLRHFCVSTGLNQQYEGGTLRARDCIGRSGKAKFKLQEDEAGNYPDRMGVEDYIVPTGNEDSTRTSVPTSRIREAAPKLDLDEDSIPF